MVYYEKLFGDKIESPDPFESFTGENPSNNLLGTAPLIPLSTLIETKKIFVVDIRTEQEFLEGRLPTAFLIDKNMLTKDENYLPDLIKRCESLKTTETCAFYSGKVEDETSVKLVVEKFQQSGFKGVSICLGGYLAAHEKMLQKKLELTDHDPRKCPLCPKLPELEIVEKWRESKDAQILTTTTSDSTSNIPLPPPSSASASSSSTPSTTSTTPKVKKENPAAPIEEKKSQFGGIKIQLPNLGLNTNSIASRLGGWGSITLPTLNNTIVEKLKQTLDDFQFEDEEARRPQHHLPRGGERRPLQRNVG